MQGKPNLSMPEGVTMNFNRRKPEESDISSSTEKVPRSPGKSSGNAVKNLTQQYKFSPREVSRSG